MLQHRDAGLDHYFVALADPTRRDVLTRLCGGPCTVSELARPLPMSLSAVGQHLRLLEAAGLVVSEKRGRVRTCRVETAALRVGEDWFVDRRHRLEHRLDRLEAHLARFDEG